MAIQVCFVLFCFSLVFDRLIFILVNDLNERRANFHLGGNDDDLSDESPPRTSPLSKSHGEGDLSKRVNSTPANRSL